MKYYTQLRSTIIVPFLVSPDSWVHHPMPCAIPHTAWALFLPQYIHGWNPHIIQHAHAYYLWLVTYYKLLPFPPLLGYTKRRVYFSQQLFEHTHSLGTSATQMIEWWRWIRRQNMTCRLLLQHSFFCCAHICFREKEVTTLWMLHVSKLRTEHS